MSLSNIKHPHKISQVSASKGSWSAITMFMLSFSFIYATQFPPLLHTSLCCNRSAYLKCYFILLFSHNRKHTGQDKLSFQCLFFSNRKETDKPHTYLCEFSHVECLHIYKKCQEKVIIEDDSIVSTAFFIWPWSYLWNASAQSVSSVILNNMKPWLEINLSTFCWQKQRTSPRLQPNLECFFSQCFKNTTFCSLSGKGSNLFWLLLCSHKKKRTTHLNWKTFSVLLFRTNTTFQKSQIRTDRSVFASSSLIREASRVPTSVLYLFTRFPWDQFPQNLSTWMQRLGRQCHSNGTCSSPGASPGRAGLAQLPRPPPRQRCGDTGTPHTPAHETNSAFSSRELSPRLPALITAASLQAFCGSAGASVLARRSPDSESRPAPPSGPRSRSGQPGGVAGGRTATAAEDRCQKMNRAFSGDPEVWPCRGRSWRVASASPPQRSAVGDDFRVTQAKLSTSAFIARCPLRGAPGPWRAPLTCGGKRLRGWAAPGPELGPAPPSGPPPGARRARSSPWAVTSRCPSPRIEQLGLRNFVSQISTAAKIYSLLNPPWARTIQSLFRTSHTPFTCVGRSPPHPTKSREVICATGWWDKTHFLQQRINSCTGR